MTNSATSPRGRKPTGKLAMPSPIGQPTSKQRLADPGSPAEEFIIVGRGTLLRFGSNRINARWALKHLHRVYPNDVFELLILNIV